MHHGSIGDEYKNITANIFKFRLKDGDLHVTDFDNQHLRLADIVNKYLREKNIDVCNRLFNFEKSIKNLVNIDDKTNMVIDYYKPKTDTEYDDKKRVVTILNEARISMLNFYTYRGTFSKLTKKYQAQRLDEVLSKYSKRSKSVREIEDHDDELSKYSERRNLDKEIEDQYLQSQVEVTIAESKLMPQKKQKTKNKKNK